MTDEKLSDGVNARSKNENIAQTGTGLPDDSSAPVQIDEAEAKRMEENLRNLGSDMPSGPDAPYDVEHANADKPISAGDAHEQLATEVQQDIDLPLKGSA